MGNYVATPQMDFVTAVKTCLQKYFDFKGRARRSEFWWFYLACYVVTGILGALIKIPMAYANSAAHDVVYNGADFASANSNYHTMLIIWAVIFGIIYLGLLIPQLSAMCRRLHDVGKSGHLMWLFLVCGIGGLIPLILCIPEGRPEPNKYGESPKFVLQQ